MGNEEEQVESDDKKFCLSMVLEMHIREPVVKTEKVERKRQAGDMYYAFFKFLWKQRSESCSVVK